MALPGRELPGKVSRTGEHFKAQLTPGEVGLLSGLLGAAAGGAQGYLLYDDPKLWALKAGIGALTTAGAGYGLAKARPWMQERMPGWAVFPKTSSLKAWADGYFDALEGLLGD